MRIDELEPQPPINGFYKGSQYSDILAWALFKDDLLLYVLQEVRNLKAEQEDDGK